MFLAKCMIISALVAVTLAFPFTLQSSTNIALKCSTFYGAKSVAPPLQTATATKTIHFLPWLGTSIYTPTSTVTPSPITTTSTVQKIVIATVTASAVTDIFSTTSTVTSTNTITAVVSSTSTETDSFSTTVSTSVTTTVPTSSGFLPIGSTTASAYPNTPGRRIKARNQISARKDKDGFWDSSYPQRVNCVNYINYFSTIIYVRTTAAKTTTLAPATSTATTTVTSTSTSTVAPPNVSTTSSFTTTATVSTITTSTSIATVTTSTTSTLTVTSTSSLYAACTPSSNNIIGPNSPNGYLEALTGSNGFVITIEPTAYDCCVQCQLSNTCIGTVYSLPGGLEDANRCAQLQIENTETCTSQSANNRAYLTNFRDDQLTFIASNGNCGYFYYGGKFGS